MRTQLKWQPSLPHPLVDLFHCSCPGAVWPGGLRAGTRNSYTFGRVSPSCPTSQMSGASSAQSQQCFLFGPTRLLQQQQLWSGPVNWKPGLWQFLDRIELLLSLLWTCTFVGYCRAAFLNHQFPISPCRMYSQIVWDSLEGFPKKKRKKKKKMCLQN